MTYGSSVLGKFVAPRTITPSFLLKPSISANNWLIVCLAYGCIGDSIRLPPMESNSSMNITHGVDNLASAVIEKKSHV